MAVQDVIDTHIQFLWMPGFELETATQIQPNVGRHLVVVHGRKVVQVVLLAEEGHRRIFARSDSLPVAGLERE